MIFSSKFFDEVYVFINITWIMFENIEGKNLEKFRRFLSPKKKVIVQQRRVNGVG